MGKKHAVAKLEKVDFFIHIPLAMKFIGKFMQLVYYFMKFIGLPGLPYFQNYDFCEYEGKFRENNILSINRLNESLNLKILFHKPIIPYIM